MAVECLEDSDFLAGLLITYPAVLEGILARPVGGCWSLVAGQWLLVGGCFQKDINEAVITAMDSNSPVSKYIPPAWRRGTHKVAQAVAEAEMWERDFYNINA